MFRYFVEYNFLKTKRNISPMFSGPLRWQAMRFARNPLTELPMAQPNQETIHKTKDGTGS
jgi:hypothetical protein